MWKYSDTTVLSSTKAVGVSTAYVFFEVPQDEVWEIKNMNSYNLTGSREIAQLYLRDKKGTETILKNQVPATSLYYQPTVRLQVYPGFKMEMLTGAGGALDGNHITYMLVDRYKQVV